MPGLKLKVSRCIEFQAFWFQVYSFGFEGLGLLRASAMLSNTLFGRIYGASMYYGLNS